MINHLTVDCVPLALNADGSPLVIDSIVVYTVNGKVRGTIEIEKGSSDEAVKEAAFKLDGVIRHTEGKEIKKIIIIKDKIVNIVAI